MGAKSATYNTLSKRYKPSYKRLKGLEAVFPQLIIFYIAVLNYQWDHLL